MITSGQLDEMGVSCLSIARREIAQTIAKYVDARSTYSTAVPGLVVGKITSPIPPTSYLFEPSLCVSAHGQKRVILGDRTYVYDENHFLLTSIGLPTIVEVPNASTQQPYIALQLILDLELAQQVIADIDAHRIPSPAADAGIATRPVTPDLVEAVARLVGLLERPDDIPILHAMIHREILYRILIGPAGGRLRQIARIGSKSHRAAYAVSWLRANFSQKLRINELARETGMGVSTLHHHFRELTTMSPLQFQKYLRLHEARRLMLSEEIDAATAAFQVGYESVTQFNREYRRLFGAPPIRDIKTLRSVGLQQYSTQSLSLGHDTTSVPVLQSQSPVSPHPTADP